MKYLLEHKWMLLIAAALLLALGVSAAALFNPGHAGALSGALDGILRPAQYASGALRDRLSTLSGDRELIDNLVNENRKLKEYIAQMDERARNYEQTEAENARLRALFEFVEARKELTLAAAGVIARDTDNYSRTLTLSKGSRHGVEPDMVAINESGWLVGVVSEVSASSSVLRTVLDPDFGCGAYIYRPSLNGFCQGQFSLMRQNLTTIIGFVSDMDIRIGDAVMTSGFDAGSVYPRDLGIGTVKDVLPDPNGMTATVIIDPYVDPRHVEQVFLILSFEEEE